MIDQTLPVQAELLSGQNELQSLRQVLQALWHLDRQRLLSWLSPPQQQHPPAQQQVASYPSQQLVLALFETLGYGYFLDDRELCSAVVQQLVALQWQVDTDEGSRFPGFYKLLAHPEASVRAQVRLNTMHKQQSTAALPTSRHSRMANTL